ncbi:putative sugar ABC transporter ATPase [Acetonema longum DSM 6540]|uniref:Putative sugar ABC transporter ATPase n=1 Tax=Acetonema longum DSM 6540 TaxID=1009370 RepID=F7NMA7_9FIRM|nr:sugar ABC transporter ATP-binding protein [Acetonema longum]EGO62845.1 putative sugar ABC transporter ATPase [Acetonema longum DSM 6540]
MSITPLLNMTGIAKTFPGVKALQDVELSLQAGEIHALLGENGAGKSTLMKILSGVYSKDAGEIRINGAPAEISDPRAAADLGISIIHQELNLIPGLTVMENIFLGREPSRKLGFIDWDEMERRTSGLLAELGTAISPEDLVADLSIGEQQMVEIAKALSYKTKILIMDEPTAALTDRETERLFAIIRQLAAAGAGIIYISHRMEELFALSNRITVLRDGSYIGTVETKTAAFDQLIRMMVGRDVTVRFPKQTVPIGQEVLRVENLSRHQVLHDVSFAVRAGEIVGFAGLMGAGRTELARAIFGVDRLDSGTIYVQGEKCTITGPADAIKAGIGLITEDRKSQGLILSLSVGKNITLASLDQYSSGGFISSDREGEAIAANIDKLKIRTPGAGQLVKNLSGGNQQKVVIAKWLATQPKVLIMDEPTRGVDVGAKAEIYSIMNMLTEAGVGIVMISSELPEILGMSDRVVVMSQGRIAGELAITDATQEKIMAYAAGGGD